MGANTAQKIVTFSAIGSIMLMAVRKGWLKNFASGIRSATGN